MAHHPPGGAAPNSRRSRSPLGLIPAALSVAVTGIPVLLDGATDYPMHTINRRSPNLFIPDSQMMFNMLSVCDHMMISTEEFLNSNPGWIPIVSQLYVSVLWVVHILRVFAKYGYGGAIIHNSIRDYFVGYEECMIPGPLVPFFQSIAAVKGPFDWIGDILPCFPSFHEFWDNTTRSPSHNYARQIPFPALMLDQLARFGASVPETDQDSNYTTFQWYSNVFNIDFKDAENLYFVGPQTCGSLYVTQSQYDNARRFWASRLGNFTRLNFNPNQPNLTNFEQVLGFTIQNGTNQFSWFPVVAMVMGNYTRYFKESVPLKSIDIAGIGSTAIHGHPKRSATVSQWLYPPDNHITPFTSTRFEPLRPIPYDLDVTFSHAHHGIEKLAERYANIAFTNINWSKIDNDNDKFIGVEENAPFYTGDYWKMLPHRSTCPVSAFSVSSLYTNVVASRYHVNYL